MQNALVSTWGVCKVLSSDERFRNILKKVVSNLLRKTVCVLAGAIVFGAESLRQRTAYEQKRQLNEEL